MNYSTTETKVGTWIDGRDVYQQVVYAPSNGRTASWYSVLTDSSIDFVIDGLAQSSQDGTPVFEFVPQCRVYNNDVQLWSESAHVMQGDWIALIYVKKATS